MRRIDTINVIPFIDIMLVLLAIVLTTATFIVEGRLDIKLPEAESGAPAQASERVEIAVDAAGNLFLDAAPVTLDDLAGHLDGFEPGTAVNLRVDGKAAFADFVAVIDLLKARRLERLSILTRAP